jgi:hypothetical protein
VLDTQHELDTRQAVEPKTALDGVVEMHGLEGSARAQLARHCSGYLQQLLGSCVRPRLLAQRTITSGHDISIHGLAHIERNRRKVRMGQSLPATHLRH